MILIIKGNPACYGKTRSQHEKNLRKEWGRTITDEQLDKLKHLEKKAYKQDRVGEKNFIGGHEIDQVK